MCSFRFDIGSVFVSVRSVLQHILYETYVESGGYSEPLDDASTDVGSEASSQPGMLLDLSKNLEC